MLHLGGKIEMSLNSLSRYDDAEDEIKDEDHGLQTKLLEQKAGSESAQEQNQSEETTTTKEGKLLVLKKKFIHKILTYRLFSLSIV